MCVCRCGSGPDIKSFGKASSMFRSISFRKLVVASFLPQVKFGGMVTGQPSGLAPSLSRMTCGENTSSTAFLRSRFLKIASPLSDSMASATARGRVLTPSSESPSNRFSPQNAASRAIPMLARASTTALELILFSTLSISCSPAARAKGVRFQHTLTDSAAW